VPLHATRVSFFSREVEQSEEVARCTGRDDFSIDLSDDYSKWHKRILRFPCAMYSDLQVASISRRPALSTRTVKCMTEKNRMAVWELQKPALAVNNGPWNIIIYSF